MKKIIAAFLAVSIFALVLSACATPPTEEMQKAHDAVIQAESDSEAVAYAGNALIRARDALTRMESEAEAKRYDAAKNYAAEAISNAERAIADGKSGAVRAKDEAASLLNSLAGSLAETISAVNNAKAQNLPLDFDSLVRDINLAQKTLDDAWQSFYSGNYLDAAGKAQNVRALLADINGRLTYEVQAASRKQ